MADYKDLQAQIRDDSDLKEIQEWQSYTPSFGTGMGTPTDVAFFYRLVGKECEVFGYFKMGAVTTGVPEISLPPGVLLDLSIVSSGSALDKIFGHAATFVGVGEYQDDLDTVGFVTPRQIANDTDVSIAFASGSTSSHDLNNTNGRFSTGEGVSVKFKVPIV